MIHGKYQVWIDAYTETMPYLPICFHIGDDPIVASLCEKTAREIYPNFTVRFVVDGPPVPYDKRPYAPVSAEKLKESGLA